MNQIAATDLLYWHQTDPIGLNSGGSWSAAGRVLMGRDRQRYVVWVDSGRWHQPRVGNGWQGRAASRPELAPRTALHLVRCRNGARP